MWRITSPSNGIKTTNSKSITIIITIKKAFIFNLTNFGCFIPYNIFDAMIIDEGAFDATIKYKIKIIANPSKWTLERDVIIFNNTSGITPLNAVVKLKLSVTYDAAMVQIAAIGMMLIRK